MLFPAPIIESDSPLCPDPTASAPCRREPITRLGHQQRSSETRPLASFCPRSVLRRSTPASAINEADLSAGTCPVSHQRSVSLHHRHLGNPSSSAPIVDVSAPSARLIVGIVQ
ncbi:hypothetical protein ACLOJK_011989 [Asimina triloba]